MNERIPRARTGVIVALSFTILGLLVAVLTLVTGRKGPAFLTMVRTSQVVAAMRANLHAAVEAEKSSVLAETEEASQTSAVEARRRLAEVDIDLRELERLIAQRAEPEEVSLLRDFLRSWETLKQVDAELLPLAVQKTNLRAQRLAYGPGAEAAERLQAALSSLVDADAPCDRGREVARWAFRAAAAAGRIHALQASHIAESSDQRMDELEASMAACHHQLVEALSRLDQVGGSAAKPDLVEARAAAERLWEVNVELIPLSRRNTDVRSLSLSLGPKQVITAQCQDLLQALQTAVESTGFRATR